MKNLLLLLFTLTTLQSFCQKQNNVWYFGSTAGISFNTSPPSTLNDGVFNHSEGVSSICDIDGNLLFFTNGIKVWNKNRLQMANGFGLLGNTSSTQILIVPKPGDCSIFYIFTTPSQSTTGSLSYSEVNMSLNGGLGDIVAKNIFLRNSVTERLSATLKSNGTDYWVVAQAFGSNTFLAYSITATGVNNNPVLSNDGVANITSPDAVGCMKISPNGNKLAYVSEIGHQKSQLFDFDNSSGKVSNGFILSDSAAYGVEFSPDNSKLYLSRYRPLKVTQYDLSNLIPASIINSMVELAFSNPNTGETEYGGALQLGPDGKIYVARSFESFLDVIENPNLLGTASNYIRNAINLNDKQCLAGLPNLINKYDPVECGGLNVDYAYTTGCFNNNITLTATAIFGQVPYQYSLDGINFQLSNMFTGLMSGNYTITVKDATTNKRSVNIFVPAIPSLSIDSLIVDNPLCGISNGKVKVLAVNGKTPYQFSLNGIDYQNSNTFTNLSQSVISFYVKDNNGCIHSKNASLTYINNTKVKVGRDTGIFINQSISLFAKDVNNVNFNTFVWKPTYGLSNASIQNPTAVIDRNIEYIVTATNTYGCSAMDTIKIDVYKDVEIYVPTIFTPNNDNLNDFLKAIPRGIKEFKYFTIYNRFGQQVFSTSNPSKGWDGKFGTLQQNTGSYIWYAEGIDLKNNIIKRKGTFTLVR
jgi:gliding motility-associated-like protein